MLTNSMESVTTEAIKEKKMGKDCLPGFFTFRAHDYVECFLFKETPMSKRAAKKYCEALGSHLAEPYDIVALGKHLYNIEKNHDSEQYLIRDQIINS